MLEDIAEEPVLYLPAAEIIRELEPVQLVPPWNKPHFPFHVISSLSEISRQRTYINIAASSASM